MGPLHRLTRHVGSLDAVIPGDLPPYTEQRALPPPRPADEQLAGLLSDAVDAITRLADVVEDLSARVERLEAVSVGGEGVSITY